MNANPPISAAAATEMDEARELCVAGLAFAVCSLRGRRFV